MMRVRTLSYASARSDSSSIVSARPVGTRKKKWCATAPSSTAKSVIASNSFSFQSMTVV